MGYARFSGNTVTGLLDASNDAAVLDLNLRDVFVGLSSAGSTAEGTLKWDQTETLTANSVSFSRGAGSGTLDLAAGATFDLDTEDLYIAFNNVGGGTSASADLDFSAGTATVALDVGNSLQIGRADGNAMADGSLTLGAGSSLTLGAEGDLADLYVGYARFSGNTVTGLLDARNGDYDLNLSNMNIGLTSAGSSATGTVVLGAGGSLSASSTLIGTSAIGSGTLDFGEDTFNVGDVGRLHSESVTLHGGRLTGAVLAVDDVSGNFSFNGGTLAVDQVIADLAQSGGVLEAGRGIGTTTVSGNYATSSTGALSISLSSDGGDVLDVDGTVNLASDLGAGADLKIDIVSDLTLGDSFIFLDNDGSDLVANTFNGLSQGETTEASFDGNTYALAVDYLAGDGNDVGLTVVDIFADLG